MNSDRHKNRHKTTDSRQRRRFVWPKLIAVLVALATVITIAAYVLYNSRDQRQSVGQTSSMMLLGRQDMPDCSKLVGDWSRTDGDYIISIRNVDPNGNVQAAYFNPNPINVYQAKFSFQENALKLFLELRDKGYPGSKYNLSYNSGQDILEGTYFAAQIQELYEVVFLRTK